MGTCWILDKDITQVVDITKIVQIPRLSFRVLFLTREGRDEGNDLLYEQVLYLFEGTYSMGIWWLVGTCWILDKDIIQVVDITKIVQIPRLSSRVLFLTREGRDGECVSPLFGASLVPHLRHLRHKHKSASL